MGETLMPTIAKTEGNRLEGGVQNIPPSSVYSQPWWRSAETNCLSSSEENVNGSPGSTRSQGNVKGFAKEKDMRSNGSGGPESQQVKHVAPTTLPMVGHHDASNQMDLVGHSIMLTSYPYPEPQFGSIMTFGAPVHPQLLGFNQMRMPLPLQMEEEPVYVNAKQYHGILRRRQSRAKAEMEKKLIKERKPYLHESRHQHALRRARGSGGRFLNTKKLESNASNSAMRKQTKSGTATPTQSGNSSGSELVSTDCNGHSDYMVEKQQVSSNGNGNVPGGSLPYYSQAHGSGRRDVLSMGLRTNHALHGAASGN
ncbi:OLC1v1001489C1 [Oldenlandia corymbosa var. corymbosa]|uniref:Nuclear transcription factor Y subunit n=1 Tax=Oldenlandia corymbosa var. corymbosa TaxID=529605 RepID=A0AAV1D5D6_OLDCO|nr:OLC1v1001489C1 [Oldenlandia corymbosa var. corymbosa]